MAITVEIKKGKHSIFPPKRSEELVADMLSKMGLDGNFTANLGQKIRGSGHTKGEVRPLRIRGNTITLAVQPGDNSTRFEVHLVIEGRNAAEIFSRMRNNGAQATAVKPEVAGLEAGAMESKEYVQDFLKKDQTETEGGKMQDGNEKETGVKGKAGRFEAKKFLKDNDHIQLTIHLLAVQQEKDGVLKNGPCVEVMKREGLIGGECKDKAVSRIFPMLEEMGYLEKEKKGFYKISEKARELLSVNLPSAQHHIKEDGVAKRKRVLISMIEDVIKIEEEMKQLKLREIELAQKMSEIKERLKTDLN